MTEGVRTNVGKRSCINPRRKIKASQQLNLFWNLFSEYNTVGTQESMLTLLLATMNLNRSDSPQVM